MSEETKLTGPKGDSNTCNLTFDLSPFISARPLAPSNDVIKLTQTLDAYNADAATFDAFANAMLCSNRILREPIYKEIRPDRWTPSMFQLCRQIMFGIDGMRAEGDTGEIGYIPLIEQALPFFFYILHFEPGYFYLIRNKWAYYYANHTEAEVAVRNKIIDEYQRCNPWPYSREDCDRKTTYLTDAQKEVDKRKELAGKRRITSNKRLFDYQRIAAKKKRAKESERKKAAKLAFSFFTQ